MKHYRKTSHAVYDIKFHVVWITKYRKPVLSGEVAIRLRDLVREICKSMDVEIISKYEMSLSRCLQKIGMAIGM
jgi:putative transposase